MTASPTATPVCANDARAGVSDRRPDVATGGLAGLPSATRRFFRRGAFLTEAGCPADVIYLIRAGFVRTFLLDEDGHETTTAIVGPGQVIGLAPLFGHAAHQTFAQALAAVEAWALPVGSLRQRLEDDANVLGLLLGSVAWRFAVALGLYRGVALLPVAERAHDIETREAACLGGSPPALNRTTLAGLIQARPETLARAVAREPRMLQPLAREDSQQTPIALADRSFGRGDVLLQNDLPAGFVGRVLAGQVQLKLVGASGRAMVVEILEAGDLWGISALLGLPSVGLRAIGLSDGAVEVLRADGLLEKLAGEPFLLRQALSRLGARLERLEQRLAHPARAHSSQHLIDLLRELAVADGQAGSTGATLPASWSHAELARQMGVCRETVTRALVDLEEHGAILRDGRRILVLPQGHVPDSVPAVSEAGRSRSSQAQDGWRSPGHSGPQHLDNDTDSPALIRADPRTLSEPVRALTRNGAAGAHAARRPGQVRMPAHDRHDGAVQQATNNVPRGSGRGHRRARCRLCGLWVEPSVLICEGCAERLELEMEMNAQCRCSACGRHQELCRVMPCAAGPQPRPTHAERARIAWLPINLIDEPPVGQNSRGVYREPLIAQLAASIREYGLLQPLCVRQNGSRYRLVFGARRLRAATRVGLEEVPCTVQVADDDRAFLLNTLENLHRRQLTGAERVRAIERLAATGLGVREVSRRTGFNPSTISRWLRIDGCPELKAALEAGTLDICRAKILVEAPRSALTHLVDEAPNLSPNELRARIASLKLLPLATPADTEDLQRLRKALQCLRGVHSAAHIELVEHIRREVVRLVAAAHVRSAPGHATA